MLSLSAIVLILTDSNQQHILPEFTYRHSFPRHWRRMWVQAWPSPAHLSFGWELAHWIHSPQGSPMSTDFQTAWPPHLLNCSGKYTKRMLPTVTRTMPSRHTGISFTCLVEKFKAWAKLIMERHLLVTDCTKRLGHYQETFNSSHWTGMIFTKVHKYMCALPGECPAAQLFYEHLTAVLNRSDVSALPRVMLIPALFLFHC